MKTELVFRVSNTRSLPLYWAYMEAWDVDVDDETGEEFVIDNRTPGSQVWYSFPYLTRCLVGEDCDGDYSWREYKLLIIIRAKKVVSRPEYPWPVVLREDVRSVRSIPTKDVYDRLLKEHPGAYDDEWGIWDTDMLEKLVEKNENKWIRWLVRNSESFQPRFVDTLSIPSTLRGLRIEKRW